MMNPNSGDESVRFTRADTLCDEARRTLFEWDFDPFRAKPSGLTWRAKNHHILLYLRDQLVSHVGLVRETVRVAGEPIPVGGIGDLITIPVFQGHGLAQLGLKEAVRVVSEEWRLKHAMFFCFPHLLPYYERLGWVKRKEPVWASQPNGRMILPVFSMVYAWDGETWPPGEVELDGPPW